MLDAILVEEFAMLVSCHYVLSIVFAIANGVRLLYASARWCVIASNGKTYHATVRECYLLLYQSLTKRATTDDGATIVVLHSTSKDFRSRSRSLVDEYYQRYILVATLTIGAILFAWRLSSFGIYYELILW